MDLVLLSALANLATLLGALVGSAIAYGRLVERVEALRRDLNGEGGLKAQLGLVRRELEGIKGHLGLGEYGHD